MFNWARRRFVPFLPSPAQKYNMATTSEATPSSSTGLESSSLLRLKSVLGYEGRRNDVLYCCPLSSEVSGNRAVVFWGGDVQDYPESMESHRDNKNYVKWNLESTALLLQSAFPQSHIIVVKASRMELKTFSCYDNFVPFNHCGTPDHTPNHCALGHLELLLRNVGDRIRRGVTEDESEESKVDTSTASAVNDEDEDDEEDGDLGGKELERREIALDDNAMDADDAEKAVAQRSKTNGEVSSSTPNADLIAQSAISTTTSDVENEKTAAQGMNRQGWRDRIDLDTATLTLVGFSKGCVVLNQLIYEFHYIKTLTPDDETMMGLVSRITDMFWLDGGHAGGKNTWITSRSLLETLTRLGISIHVHVTPYQVNDERRPWIRREEKAFTDLLRRLGAPLKRTVHFENQVSNLHTHFEVLAAFAKTIK